VSFDLDRLRAAVEAHGSVARIVVAAADGSTPREAGAAMLVWAEGQWGTIGGGALEFAAVDRARTALARGRDRLDREPLGPALGQCCGGAVTLLTEVWTEARLAGLGGDLVARPVPGGPEIMPLSVRRLLAAARNRGARPGIVLKDGWMVEPVLRPARALWVWGAGHVGRAIVAVLAPFPELAITWIDVAADRFPETIPDGVTRLLAANPADLAAHAPAEADHLILTYSHALDLELCHRLLGRGFAACGLIGSRTKWARFRSRLSALGHSEASIARIRCPIGDPALGKHPQAIAVGVAHQILNAGEKKTAWKDGTG
jgi:xanthine dehydrogenase accessory factor